MSERKLLLDTLEKEIKVRKEIKNHPLNSLIFQPLVFFGSKYNQELISLSQEDNGLNINFIDFGKIGVQKKTCGKWVKKELKLICRKSNPDFSLICFLNLNEISGTVLEKSLLPFFDHHQNIQHEGLDLSNFILLGTSSTSQLGELSPPLVSRLKCINQKEVKFPKNFLDKHFSLVLGVSILLVFIGLFFIFWPNQTKK